MKKLLITSIVSASLLTSAVMANEEDCSFNFDHDLSVINNAITISQSTTDKVFIDNNNQLFINDEKQSLTTQQQSLVDAYADNIRILVPEVTSIAVEGVGLGIDAASMAIGTLLGEGDPDYLEFVQKVQDLGDKIIAKIDASQFNSKELERAFADEFEGEIEAFVEQTVNELTPRLMAKVMTAALTDDGAISDIERRAEDLEANIKAMVEPRVELLEQRAEELCSIVKTLNAIETDLVNSGLKSMDLIKANGNSINFNTLDKIIDKSNYSINLGD